MKTGEELKRAVLEAAAPPCKLATEELLKTEVPPGDIAVMIRALAQAHARKVLRENDIGVDLVEAHVTVWPDGVFDIELELDPILAD